MNLIDAIKSGRPFRRKGVDTWILTTADLEHEFTWKSVGTMFMENTPDPRPVKYLELSMKDLLANDWEIQEQSITITRNDFLNAFSAALKDVESRHGFRIVSFRGRAVPPLWESEVIAEMVRKLGLEE